MMTLFAGENTSKIPGPRSTFTLCRTCQNIITQQRKPQKMVVILNTSDLQISKYLAQ